MAHFEYQITNKISQTPYATLFKGVFINQEGTQSCFIKRFHVQHIAPDDLTQIKLTYKLLQQIKDEHILQVVAVEESTEGLLLIQKDFSGHPLNTKKENLPLPLNRFFQIAIPLTKAITLLHTNQITHGHLKPKHILLDNEQMQMKVWNVGMLPFLAKETSWYDQDILKETLPYISPEQSGRVNYAPDYRTDFYSLGIIFYELLTGTVPFVSDDPLDLIHSHLARQPIPLVEHRQEIPLVISDIVMKLLAKEPDSRYQSGNGLHYDLINSQKQWMNSDTIHPFTLGLRDKPDQFLMPRKLFGRRKELHLLQNIFAEVKTGVTKAVLVAGSAGIGKSNLIEALQKTVIQQNGFFIRGKFDAINQNQPYSGIIQALQMLIRQLLGESDQYIQQWREKLQPLLGEHGQLLLTLVPEVEQIIGSQPPMSSDNYSERNNQIRLVFQQFIRVFAQKERPLLFLLEDLHWADNASIQIFKQLLSGSETGALFLIGTYRDNELTPVHPTSIMLADEAIDTLPLQQITLKPMRVETVTAWLAETLNKPLDNLLATIIYQKTAGNPFFIKTFMQTLIDEDLLFYDLENGWQWHLAEIENLQVTENAAELKAQQINQVPEETRNILLTAACLGTSFDLELVATIGESSQEETYIHIRSALQAGLLLKQGHRYRFSHDRIHEATYSLMIPKEQIARHLAIGRCLLKQATETAVSQHPFLIVDQLNAGLAHVTNKDEKIKIAQLNMHAGQKSLQAAAYQSAAKYFNLGHSLLPNEAWQTHYDFTFKLHLLLVEAEYLSGNFSRADKLYPILLTRGRTSTNKLDVYLVQIAQYHLQGKFQEALAIGKKGLLLLGIDLPPSQAEIHQLFKKELAQFETTMQIMNLSDLLQAPAMTNPKHIQLTQLLSFVANSSYFTDSAVQSWTAIKMVNLSLTSGHHETSAYAYAGYGHVVAIPLLQEYEYAYQLGEIGIELAQKYNNLALRGKTYFRFGLGIIHWRKHFDVSIPILYDAYRYALEGGNLTYAGFALFHWLHNRIISGKNLVQIQMDAQKALPFLQQTNINFLEAAFCPGILQALASLLGQMDDLPSFNNDQFDESVYLSKWQHLPVFVSAFYCAKIRSLYFLGHYQEGLALQDTIEVIANAGPQQPLAPEATFFMALMITAVYENAPSSLQKEYDKLLQDYLAQLKTWAQNGPDNYEHKYLLLAAEQKRLTHSVQKAIPLYRQSIQAAQNNRFIHIEALGNELYGRFWHSVGENIAAESYLIRAYNLYQQWGATAKLTEMEMRFPDLFSTIQNRTNNATTIPRLDLLTVMKATQAIAEEINLDKLLSKMMAIIVENAGAQKGVLITETDGRLLVQAEWIENEQQAKRLQKLPIEDSKSISLAIVNYVKRTNKNIVLDEASNHPQFANDPYIRQQQPKSVLCMPMTNQGRLVAILYLENNLTTDAFTPERLEILNILSAQAAVSIENATLYANMQSSEKKYRNLFSDSKDAIFMSTHDGRFLDMNPAGLSMLGFTEEELHSNPVADIYANPADRIKFLEIMKANNVVEDFETDFRHKDGTIIHVRFSATTHITEDGEIAFQGITKDITQQKKAEVRLLSYMKELERSNRELQRFAYIASHDLQEPLRKVRTFSDRLESLYGDTLDERGLNYLNRMRNAASRMQTLIEDLLTFSHVSTRIQPFEPTDLNRIVQDVLLDLDLQIETLHAQITVSNLPVIDADPLQMRQLFQNLLSNALKFHQTGTNPDIDIVTKLFSEGLNSFCQITVSDNGIGFEEKYLDRIFTVFQRLHDRTEYDGTGVGLAICRRIIERHNGQITATSQPGKGTSFIVTLPTRQQQV